mmetsp:Transcript_46613/g.116128  ORF Transcript_46613/g.116128 Transcript_46613/m.116128 type:complete len:220 (+) Transcript_46613:1240-1899(+)
MKLSAGFHSSSLPALAMSLTMLPRFLPLLARMSSCRLTLRWVALEVRFVPPLRCCWSPSVTSISSGSLSLSTKAPSESPADGVSQSAPLALSHSDGDATSVTGSSVRSSYILSQSLPVTSSLCVQMLFLKAMPLRTSRFPLPAVLLRCTPFSPSSPRQSPVVGSTLTMYSWNHTLAYTNGVTYSISLSSSVGTPLKHDTSRAARTSTDEASAGMRSSMT